ncbi:MAG: efflux RND transporter periplasmic adaptor subunit [Anaerolineae bacterium]|jgi:HlyD family secretion protein
MSKALKIGGIVILVLALVAGAAMALRAVNQPAAAEDSTALVAEVTRGSIEETVSATGNVGVERQVALPFGSSGEIAEVLVEDGQTVEAGDVLARLDTGSLEWQIARSQASVDTAQARLEQAKKPAGEKELASAQAALESAKAGYQQVQEGASAEDLASAQAALDSAKANYDRVKAGPTKAELAAAQAQLDSAKAAVQQAQAAYDRVKDRPFVGLLPEALNLQNATITLQQAQANYDAQANRPTRSELASANAQVAQAAAQLAALQERPTAGELASAAAQVAQAEATLAQLQDRPSPEDIAVLQAQVDEAQIVLAQTESQLEDTVITAPFGGTVIAVQVREGEWASPGAPAIVLAFTDSLILEVNVDEVDVAGLAEGQAAHLTFGALDDAELGGTVSFVAPSSTNVGGAVAYAVEVRFDPGELPIRLGMTADVDIVVDSANDALLVPNRAIEVDREAGLYYVTRQKALGATERLEVRIGMRDQQNTQILEGVDEGDKVVLPEVPEQTTSQEFSGPFGGMR